jgi:RND family efflux transporter MFP subunit
MNTNSTAKRNGIFIFIVILVGLALFLLQHRSSSEHKKPEQASANSPAMKMQGEAPAPPDNREVTLVPIQLTPQRMQSIGVTFGTVEFKDVTDDIRATGNVEMDERRVSYVQVRFPGWIRTVFANETYEYVRRGQPLFKIYSPDLVATQREYLVAQQNLKSLQASTVEGVSSGAAALTVAAEERLKQWQVPATEIAKLKESGKPISDLVIDSPTSGYITEKNAFPNMQVQPETKLYTITDLSTVWVYAEVFQNDVGKLKPGDAAVITVDAYPGKNFIGHIQEILPQVQMSTRTLRVRIVMSNPGLKLKPGMYVNVQVRPSFGRQLVVPATAVFNSGVRKMAFVNRGEGLLEPREVEVGSRVADGYIVLKGLNPRESVVTSANFLIDSESQLQGAAGAFTPPPPGAGGAGGVAAVSTQASALNVEFRTDPATPRKGKNTMRVKVTDENGEPVAGAEVTVTNFMAAMPAMGMAAMSGQTKLSENTPGMYEGIGELDTGGTWQVTITVSKAGQVIATKHLTINATGGM